MFHRLSNYFLPRSSCDSLVPEVVNYTCLSSIIILLAGRLHSPSHPSTFSLSLRQIIPTSEETAFKWNTPKSFWITVTSKETENICQVLQPSPCISHCCFQWVFFMFSGVHCCKDADWWVLGTELLLPALCWSLILGGWSTLAGVGAQNESSVYEGNFASAKGSSFVCNDTQGACVWARINYSRPY